MMNNTKVMKATTYTGLLWKIFEELQVIASHYGHFGRVSAPVKLEFEEVLPELIRILGKFAEGVATQFIVALLFLFLLML